MIALSLAIAVVALLGWDGFRRKLALDASRSTKLEERVTAVEQALESVRAEVPRQQEAIKNGVREMRGLLAPLQNQVLAAQQQRERS